VLYPSELRAREHYILSHVRYSDRAMARQPFVWEVHIRRDMIEDEVVRLRELPYTLWRDALGVPRAKEVVGRDSRTYRVTVTADWARQGAQDIRVTVRLTRPGSHRTLAEEGFTITPDNQIGPS
jgi:hypothetical protein